MTERERLVELITNAKRDDPEDGSFTEFLADYLLAKDAFAPPVKVGDKIYVAIWDFLIDEWYIADETVTEVGSRGCFVSGYRPARDDIDSFFPWENFGVQVGSEIVCFTLEEAETALAERQANPTEKGGAE